jgi:hypothetical protein
MQLHRQSWRVRRIRNDDRRVPWAGLCVMPLLRVVFQFLVTEKPLAWMTDYRVDL